MKFSDSLKKNKDFQNVYNNGVSFANRYLVMYVLKNNTENNRIKFVTMMQTVSEVLGLNDKLRLIVYVVMHPYFFH